jgi:hypothetical protein
MSTSEVNFVIKNELKKHSQKMAVIEGVAGALALALPGIQNIVEPKYIAGYLVLVAIKAGFVAYKQNFDDK